MARNRRRTRTLPRKVTRTIRAVRGERTLDEMRKILGCSLSHYYEIEQGRARPRLDELPAWCKTTGLPAEVFYPELEKVAPFMQKLAA